MKKTKASASKRSSVKKPQDKTVKKTDLEKGSKGKVKV